MPRTKKITTSKNESSAVTKKKVVKKGVAKSSSHTKKSSSSQVKSSKAKPVVVDIIEDDLDLDGEQNFFPDNSLGGLYEDNEVEGKSEKDKEVLELDQDDAGKFDLEENDNDIDKQKQFFSDLVSDMKNKQNIVDGDEVVTVKEKRSTHKSVSMYRSMVWKFLVLVLLLAAGVFYVSYSKLTIFITPQVETMNDVLFLKVVSDTNAEQKTADIREKVSGTINELELSVESKYRATGEEFLGEEVSGTVTIINNNNKPQALVATTRLLSVDGKLFRIKEAVNVPAGGSVEVEVYADKVSADMAISPTRFTIPGLWVGLQDKIYAESKVAFSYNQKIQRYVKTSDLQLANSEAATLILNKAKDLKPLREQDQVLYKIVDPIVIDINANNNDAVEEFTMTAKAKVVLVSFSSDEVKSLAAAKLNILVPDDKELVQMEPENLTYVLEDYNKEEQTATIKSSFSGLMVLRSNADVIDLDSLVNLTADQIAVYLKDYPEIGNYQLEFYPDFVKRAPRLVERIEVKIKQ